jgi:hypothetical protein
MFRAETLNFLFDILPSAGKGKAAVVASNLLSVATHGLPLTYRYYWFVSDSCVII